MAMTMENDDGMKMHRLMNIIVISGRVTLICNNIDNPTVQCLCSHSHPGRPKSQESGGERGASAYTWKSRFVDIFSSHWI